MPRAARASMVAGSTRFRSAGIPGMARQGMSLSDGSASAGDEIVRTCVPDPELTNSSARSSTAGSPITSDRAMACNRGSAQPRAITSGRCPQRRPSSVQSAADRRVFLPISDSSGSSYRGRSFLAELEDEPRCEPQVHMARTEPRRPGASIMLVASSGVSERRHPQARRESARSFLAACLTAKRVGVEFRSIGHYHTIGDSRLAGKAQSIANCVGAISCPFCIG